jgi:hypothetical protein
MTMAPSNMPAARVAARDGLAESRPMTYPRPPPRAAPTSPSATAFPSLSGPHSTPGSVGQNCVTRLPIQAANPPTATPPMSSPS